MQNNKKKYKTLNLQPITMTLTVHSNGFGDTNLFIFYSHVITVTCLFILNNGHRLLNTYTELSL